MDMGLSGLRELVMDREAWSAVVHGVSKSQTRLSDWTDWTELIPKFKVVAKAILEFYIDKHLYNKEKVYKKKKKLTYTSDN